MVSQRSAELRGGGLRRGGLSNGAWGEGGGGGDVAGGGGGGDGAKWEAGTDLISDNFNSCLIIFIQNNSQTMVDTHVTYL